MENKIEKCILLKAPISLVWRAITDYNEFGQWFCVKLEGPFMAGQISRGYITYPGYEHIKWEVVVKEIKPENLFSFTWHPYAIDPNIDYSSEIPTLVEFKLKEVDGGTLLTIIESGFDKIPKHRYSDAMRMNNGGWTEQIKNIEKHVTT